MLSYPQTPRTDANLSPSSQPPKCSRARLSLSRDPLSLEAFGTQTHISKENATKGDLHHLSSLSGAASWAHGVGWGGGRESPCFPHVALCYFFHPPGQEAAQISGKQPLSVFSEAKRVVPLYFPKRQTPPCSMNHYLENNRKESNPPLSGPKESGRAAF